MTINEFYTKLIKSDIGDLSAPFDSYLKCQKDMLDYVHDFCTEYLNILQSLDSQSIKELTKQTRSFVCSNRFVPFGTFNLLNDVEKISDMIIAVITQYYKGFPMIATEIMEKFFKKRHCHYFQLLPQLSYSKRENGPSFYRMRSEKCKTQLELFHIPFEKRYLA